MMESQEFVRPCAAFGSILNSESSCARQRNSLFECDVFVYPGTDPGTSSESHVSSLVSKLANCQVWKTTILNNKSWGLEESPPPHICFEDGDKGHPFSCGAKINCLLLTTTTTSLSMRDQKEGDSTCWSSVAQKQETAKKIPPITKFWLQIARIKRARWNFRPNLVFFLFDLADRKV